MVEVIISLVIVTMVLASIVSLTYAVAVTTESTDDNSKVQAQLRISTMRITELIKHCRLICHHKENNLAIWAADDNEDGQINLAELVYIGSDANKNYLRILKFHDEDRVLQLNQIELLSNLANYGTENYTESFLLPTCSNLKFTLDQDPPYTQLASVGFDLSENEQSHHYSTDVTVGAWAGHLLSLDGSAIVTDDDEGSGSGADDSDDDDPNDPNNWWDDIDPNDPNSWWEIDPNDWEIDPNDWEIIIIEPIKPPIKKIKFPKPPIASPWM